MKIESPVSPQTPPRTPVNAAGRKASAAEPKAVAPEAAPAKPAEARDTVQISAEASALQSAADATKTAVDTRELIAKNNQEAALAQPVDTKRLQELLQTMGVSAQANVSITA